LKPRRKSRRLWSRRGVSTVVANMMMIAITLSLSAILITWAGNSFGSFSSGSQLFFVQRGQALQERFVAEEVFFNATSSNHNIMIFVRNVGLIDIKIARFYISTGTTTSTFSPSQSATASWLCQGMAGCVNPSGTTYFDLPVQQVVEFNFNYGSSWTTGTVFTIVVATLRGNQVATTARGP